MKSIRPHLLRVYEQIVKEYKLNNWGIYDDTDYLHRAIAWSDAYYGDESSVMFLYLATGKPFSTIAKSACPASTNNESDFSIILNRRISNMQQEKGANVKHRNMLIDWNNFSTFDFKDNIQYENFLDRYIHFVTHTEMYPGAELYRNLSLKMYRDFVVNPDGTAGREIYNYCKKKVVQ